MLKHLKTLQHVSIIIQIIFRELVCSLLKSLILKFVKNVKSQCGDVAVYADASPHWLFTFLTNFLALEILAWIRDTMRKWSESTLAYLCDLTSIKWETCRESVRRRSIWLKWCTSGDLQVILCMSLCWNNVVLNVSLTVHHELIIQNTNVMHLILFVRQIFSSTCFEYQVLILRRNSCMWATYGTVTLYRVLVSCWYAAIRKTL